VTNEEGTRNVTLTLSLGTGIKTAFAREKGTVKFRQYTGCPRRNVPDFGRVFLMLKYTDITQNTYVQI
jgi:hypothetical protein